MEFLSDDQTAVFGRFRGELARADLARFFHLDAARRSAYTWIDGWYNGRSRHSSIGCLSPLEYERRQFTLAA